MGADVFEGLVDGVVVGVSRGLELDGLVFVGDGDKGAFVVALFLAVVWFLMILLFVFAFQEFVDERREGNERYVAHCSSFDVFEVEESRATDHIFALVYVILDCAVDCVGDAGW